MRGDPTLRQLALDQFQLILSSSFSSRSPSNLFLCPAVPTPFCRVFSLNLRWLCICGGVGGAESGLIVRVNRNCKSRSAGSDP